MKRFSESGPADRLLSTTLKQPSLTTNAVLEMSDADMVLILNALIRTYKDNQQYIEEYTDRIEDFDAEYLDEMGRQNAMRGALCDRILTSQVSKNEITPAEAKRYRRPTAASDIAAEFLARAGFPDEPA